MLYGCRTAILRPQNPFCLISFPIGDAQRTLHLPPVLLCQSSVPPIVVPMSHQNPDPLFITGICSAKPVVDCFMSSS